MAVATVTDRETRLRERIDRLTDDRDQARGKLARLELSYRLAERALLGHCVYCGAPAADSVCWAHSDLVKVDPGAPTVLAASGEMVAA